MVSISQSERVRDIMEAAIINGEYKPGVKLDLELLAKSLAALAPLLGRHYNSSKTLGLLGLLQSKAHLFHNFL